MTSALIITPATHVIFDLDGTLLDTERSYEDALIAVCNFYKKDIPKALVRKAINLPVEDGCWQVIDNLHINVDIDTFVKKYRLELERIIPQCKLMSGATKLVYHLQKFKIPMGLVCSSDLDMFTIKIKKYGQFFKHFNPIVLASDPYVKNLKPAPDMYSICCRRFAEKPNPKHCLVIEDSPFGVQAALAAKMQVVLVSVKHLATKASDDATMVVTNLINIDLSKFDLPPLHE